MKGLNKEPTKVKLKIKNNMDFGEELKLMKQSATIRKAEDINVSYEEALNIAPPN